MNMILGGLVQKKEARVEIETEWAEMKRKHAALVGAWEKECAGLTELGTHPRILQEGEVYINAEPDASAIPECSSVGGTRGFYYDGEVYVDTVIALAVLFTSAEDTPGKKSIPHSTSIGYPLAKGRGNLIFEEIKSRGSGFKQGLRSGRMQRENKNKHRPAVEAQN
ncbi:hypothetical protein B0H14DRAFT_2631049 [Mycena olivaceomarginata]|nr:hypothetical protein B0H14DRAFT_2631049 [Mycena olivaceomarginata]